MIHVEHVSKAFGTTRAVQRLSFQLRPGKITGLLGPNGAGKTTTIRLIAGYLRPDQGRVFLDGIHVAAQPARARQRLGYLPESAPLYPELDPHQYLDYRARLFGLRRTDRRRAIQAAIQRCRLQENAHKRIGLLSKGYRQRVGLAAAILHDPPVLILDEPTNGLDPSQIRSTRELIAQLAQDRTVLLCTHIIPEVERTCDRAIVIAAGKLVADDTPANLARGPGGHVELECRGPHDPALSHALHEAGIRDPRITIHTDGWLTVLATRNNGDTAERLARAATEAGRPIRRLQTQPIPLEERLIDLIEQDKPPQTTTTGGAPA